MPVGRWVLLVIWVTLSLVVSLGALVWSLMMPDARPAVRGPNVLQLLELGIAAGLFLRKDWAHYWGVRWYLVKTIYCLGIAAGIGIGSGWQPQHPVMLSLGLFWGGLTVFLWWNRVYFD